MWLVLGQHNDVEAEWMAAGLRARADRPVVLITDAQLVHDCRWELRVGATGASSRLELGDGTVLDPATVDGVVNRLCWLGAEAFAGASARDREYATSELYALGLGWLESLGDRVVNRPAGSGLCGQWRRPAEWATLARSVGLPIVPFDTDDPAPDAWPPGDHAVLVVDGDVVTPTLASAPPALGPGLRDGLATLQKESGLDLLEVWLAARPDAATDSEGSAVCSASFLAAMSRFGDAGLDAVHDALMARLGAPR
jgi:hypothetical protein